MKWRTYIANDGQQLVRIGLGNGATAIHLVHDEGDGAGPEFLDEKVAEEIVIPREVAHVHNLGRAPYGQCGRARARLGLRHNTQREVGGRRRRRREKGNDGGRLVAGEEVVKDAPGGTPCGNRVRAPNRVVSGIHNNSPLCFHRPLRHCSSLRSFVRRRQSRSDSGHALHTIRTYRKSSREAVRRTDIAVAVLCDIPTAGRHKSPGTNSSVTSPPTYAACACFCLPVRIFRR